MTSRSDSNFSALRPLPSLLLFSLLVSQVCGIARISKPVVFSYSSGGNSNHPAVISHHYRPMPVDGPTRPPELQIVEQFTTPRTFPKTVEASESTSPIVDNDRSSEESYASKEPPVHPENTVHSSAANENNSYQYSNGGSSVDKYENRQPHAVGHRSAGRVYHDNSELGSGASHEEMRNFNDVPISSSMEPVSTESYGQQTDGDRSADKPGRINSVGAESVMPANRYRRRGGLTYTPTPIYDELINEHNIDVDPDYISTTPLPTFESIRNKLPSINEYPPPNRGYITSPVSTSPQINNSGNNKILQQPKFFAYSNDGPGAYSSEGDDDVDQPHHSHHKKAAEKHVKGGGLEHHSSQAAAGGAEGGKGYKSHQEHDRGDKGHHDKEAHKGKYKDERGTTGKKKELAAHYDATHQAEKGKKSAKYGESGEHKKGHSTKGEHNVHTKDEYLKKHEFYDEHHEGGDHEKSGGFKSSHGHRRGGKKKKGHKKSGFRHQHKGKKGFRDKGGKLGHQKRHKVTVGADDHFKHHKKYWSKGGRKQGKKWGFSSPGHPEK